VALDDQIDDLYRLPLGEFTAARNALAKSLSGGDATRVKKLEKPTVVPWAVNQLYWHDRGAYDRLMKTGGAVRTAQIGALEGKNTDVRRATESHRKALAEAVERAIQLAAKHDASPGPEPLARTLEALSTSNVSFHPGRLTDTVQPAGFEALTGVTPHALPARPTRVADSKAKAAAKPAPVVDREAMKRAEAERKAKEARVAAAERTLERARAAVTDARRALAEAEEHVRAAESALFRAKR
jgi:hypothetical protein